ncbi:hypothetical protein HYDPIDRAFT_116178 [Hydnomerulius pinastri MD-312]|uniref:Uncharacterized protein n=1 Tax=Hydnomerulius pinastri MD-312 TaxID=994086 RepID=A0A0C9WBX6_9AGAM|nr:hypothetical protein HYDPIDRAFT_116178 [Hydnomerulius pinastri MD-312]
MFREILVATFSPSVMSQSGSSSRAQPLIRHLCSKPAYRVTSMMCGGLPSAIVTCPIKPRHRRKHMSTTAFAGSRS